MSESTDDRVPSYRLAASPSGHRRRSRSARSRVRGGIAAGVLALIAGLACAAASSETSAHGSRGGSASEDETAALAGRACDALHGIAARRRSECCSAPAPSLGELCTRELDAALRRGAVRIEASALERCAKSAERHFAGCAWVRPTAVRPPAECRSLVRGRLAAGSACESSLECEPGLHCRGVAPERSGRCAPPAAAGARCAVPADRLAAVLGGPAGDHPECDGICIRGRCVARSEEGDACASSALCRPGLRCVDGRCANRPAPRIGEPCPERSVCADGAYCRGGTCIALGEAGASCTLPFECASLACRKEPGARSGRCGDRCGSTGRPVDRVGARKPRDLVDLVAPIA